MPAAFRASRDVVLRTKAWAEAVEFYQSVLGLQLLEQSEGFAGFDAGAFHLFVAAGEAHGPVFEFLVPDLEAAKTRLMAAGCTVFEDDPTDPHLYMRDPHGLVYNLARAPAAG
jgi:catechol 2,3-dioxygenase-like lactoylglutathione lyase family enzyme